MKKAVIPVAFLFLLVPAAGFGQQVFKEVSLVVNIEVPVRVFDGGRFVDDLTIDDFALLEDGISQKIEAVYLVKRSAIERSDERKRFNPSTKRHYFLFFEVTRYWPRLTEAMEFLIQEVLFPEDDLIITTPLKTYRLKEGALQIKPREEIVKEMRRIIRRDVEQGNQEYKQTIRQLVDVSQRLATSLGASPSQSTSAPVISAPRRDLLTLEMLLMEYADLLAKLENLRKVDQIKMVDFAQYLKGRPGQKNVYMFYEREFIPRVDSKIVDQFKTHFQDNPAMLHTISSLFDFYTREEAFDSDLVKKAYSDSSTAIHFLFLTERQEGDTGVTMEEHSEDLFAAFREMALATGGLVVGSSNPAFSFRKALEASENYYLYYSPKDKSADGSFREIQVRVKGRDYRISHRSGYFAK